MPRETFTREEVEYCLKTHMDRHRANPGAFSDDEDEETGDIAFDTLKYYDELLDERSGAQASQD